MVEADPKAMAYTAHGLRSEQMLCLGGLLVPCPICFGTERGPDLHEGLRLFMQDWGGRIPGIAGLRCTHVYAPDFASQIYDIHNG